MNAIWGDITVNLSAWSVHQVFHIEQDFFFWIEVCKLSGSNPLNQRPPNDFDSLVRFVMSWIIFYTTYIPTSLSNLSSFWYAIPLSKLKKKILSILYYWMNNNRFLNVLNVFDIQFNTKENFTFTVDCRFLTIFRILYVCDFSVSFHTLLG